MVTKVHMEALSPTMEEGQLVRWLKSEGDEVSNGDVLAEIETDKATMELVARGAGVLRKIFLDEGGTAAVGSVIGVIADADEDISGVEGASGGGGDASGDDGKDEGAEAKEDAEEDEAASDEAASDEASESKSAEAPAEKKAAAPSGEAARTL